MSGCGFFIVAIDPKIFTPADDFRRRVADYAESIRISRPVAGAAPGSAGTAAEPAALMTGRKSGARFAGTGAALVNRRRAGMGSVSRASSEGSGGIYR